MKCGCGGGWQGLRWAWTQPLGCLPKERKWQVAGAALVHPVISPSHSPGLGCWCPFAPPRSGAIMTNAVLSTPPPLRAELPPGTTDQVPPGAQGLGAPSQIQRPLAGGESTEIAHGVVGGGNRKHSVCCVFFGFVFLPKKLPPLSLRKRGHAAPSVGQRDAANAPFVRAAPVPFLASPDIFLT